MCGVQDSGERSGVMLGGREGVRRRLARLLT